MHGDAGFVTVSTSGSGKNIEFQGFKSPAQSGSRHNCKKDVKGKNR